MVAAGVASKDEALRHVSELLRVPVSKRRVYEKLVALAIHTCTGGSTHPMPRRGETLRMISLVQRASPEQGLALLGKETPASQAARVMLAIASSPTSPDLEWLSLERSQTAPVFAAAREQASRMFRDGGRTPGTPNNAAFDLFVKQLYYYTMLFGGAAGTMSKKGARGILRAGRFYGALKVIAPHAPGLIPTSDNSIINAFRRAAQGWGVSQYQTFEN